MDRRRIRQLRRERCLTQAELGAKIGLGQYTISKIENGRIGRPDCLAELAAVFGLREVDLLVLPDAASQPGRAAGSVSEHGAGGGPGPDISGGDGPLSATTTEDPLYWTVPEAAAVLEMSRHLVYRLVKVGDLTAERAGRSWRITTASVRAYQADPARQRPQPAPPYQQRLSLLHIDKQRLRALRQERGWTQLELARRARLSLSRVSGLETGHNTKTSAIPALANALGVEPAELEAPRRGHRAGPQPGTDRTASTLPDSVTPRNVVGARLRELRIKQGLTQTEVAHRAQISRPFLSSLEHGHRHRPDLIPRLTQALNATPADLPSPMPLDPP